MAEARTKQVNVRLTEGEYLQLQARAIDRGITVPEALYELVVRMGDGPMATALAEAIEAAGDEARDAAARQLAREYASQLDDDPGLYSDLGPKFLAILNALGLTPAGRKAPAATPPAGPAPAKSTAAALREEVDEVGRKRAERAASPA